jgi:hypothetical protein
MMAEKRARKLILSRCYIADTASLTLRDINEDIDPDRVISIIERQMENGQTKVVVYYKTAS